MSSNKLEYIGDCLASLVELQQLDLSSNKIRVIEGLASLKKLVVLNLSGNKIASIVGLKQVFGSISSFQARITR